MSLIAWLTIDDDPPSREVRHVHGAAPKQRENEDSADEGKGRKNEADLLKAIENGQRQQTPKMPPFKDTLTGEQIQRSSPRSKR